MLKLSKDDILRGLRKIDTRAKEAGVVIDLSIYGGAALALVFDLRLATRDVDAVVGLGVRKETWFTLSQKHRSP